MSDCIICGKYFESPLPQKITCSNKCYKKRKSQLYAIWYKKNQKEILKKHSDTHPDITKPCIMCGEDFTTRNPNQLACNKQCQFLRRKQTSRNHLDKPDVRKKRVQRVTEYKKNNPEKIKNYLADYYKKNQDKNYIRQVHRNQHSKKPFSKVCQECGSIENLEIHHITYSKVFNGLILCRTCHGKRHQKYNFD